MRLIYWFFALFLLLPFAGNSQSYKSLKAEGDRLFEDGFYELAVERYEECFRERPTDYEMDFRLGISYLMLNRLYEAETVLNIIYAKKKNRFPTSIYYLGYLHHRKLDFQKAAIYYKEFYKKNNLQNFESLVKIKLRNCESGIIIKRKKALGAVDAFLEPINSIDNDFHPILSPNRPLEKIYFSSNRLGVLGGLRNDQGKEDNKGGHRNPDMFVAELKPVLNVERMSGMLNTSLFDEVVGFSFDGTKMYYKKGYIEESGLLYEDYYNRSNKDRISGNLLEVPFDMQQGDATPFFFMDTLVIFSSRRLEGFGGYDLFISNKTPDGWTEPKNMGANINGPFDEKYPFLTNNQEGLYFCSNKPEGLGGFDIYKSAYSPILKRWNKGNNLGIPINSADDEQYFQMASDGWNFVFSSNRHESMGKFDIFQGQFFEQQADQVVMTMEVENDRVSDSLAMLAKPVLFQKYSFGTVIPDSTMFAELRMLAQILNDHPNIGLSLNVTRTSQRIKGMSNSLDPLSSVLLSFIKTNAPNTKIDFTQSLLAPQKSKEPGNFLEAVVLGMEPEVEKIAPINNVQKHSFVPRIPIGLRYKIDVSAESEGLEDFLIANKYSFSFSLAKDNQLRLLYGRFFTLETAQQWAEQLHQAGIQVLRIIPCISGKPIAPTTNPALLRPYPELYKYLLE